MTTHIWRNRTGTKPGPEPTWMTRVLMVRFIFWKSRPIHKTKYSFIEEYSEVLINSVFSVNLKKTQLFNFWHHILGYNFQSKYLRMTANYTCIPKIAFADCCMKSQAKNLKWRLLKKLTHILLLWGQSTQKNLYLHNPLQIFHEFTLQFPHNSSKIYLKLLQSFFYFSIKKKKSSF